jgi:lysophospholipase L1-like esterase
MVVQTLRRGAAAVFVFFVAIEVLLRAGYMARNSMVNEIPLPYMIGDEYGPSPPWLESLRLLEPDEELMWRNHPNLHRRYLDMFTPAWSENARVSLLRRFLPGVPQSFRANPVWDVALNSEGFRGEEFPNAKSAGTFRIVCLGDSWTFGANVGTEQTYPRQLQRLLEQQFPGARFEVLNLGVLGYSSFQGLELWKRRAEALEPDLVVIGYAMNDARMAGYRDKDMVAAKTAPRTAAKVAGLLTHFESFKLLRYLALTTKSRPRSVGEYVQQAADAAANGTGDMYETFEPWTRVGPTDYERNITELIGLAKRRGAGVILVYNDLDLDSRYRATLRAIARTRGIPLVDSSELIAAARRRREEDLEDRLALRPVPARRARPDGNLDVIFRVYLGTRPVPDGVYIAGAHPALGDLVPNSARMYDDGTHGDQRAGDAVWSFSATVAPDTRLFFVYTNSGTRGKWEGLDVPAIRHVRVDATGGGNPRYLPIDSFGEMYLQADAWHTNTAGYGLIAQALGDVLRATGEATRYLGRVSTSSTR